MSRLGLTLPTVAALVAAPPLLACGSADPPPVTTAGLGDGTMDAGESETLPNPDPTFDSLEDGTTAGDDTSGEAGTSVGADTAGADTSGSTARGTDDTGREDSSSGGDGASSSEGGESTGPGVALDVSDWVITQANSAREFTIPAGVVLEPGMMIVVARDASLAEFEAWWGVVLGPDVLYFDTDDTFPAINGDETFTLTDDGGAVIDGPTPMLTVGDNFQRIDAALPGNDTMAWEVSTNPNSDGGPGSVTAAAPDAPGLILTEYSDTTGAGAFLYEFVELQYVP